MNKICKVLFSVLLSIIGILPLKAEVFTSTYTTTPCPDDVKIITEMLIGSGIALHPSGDIIKETHSAQVGIYSNLVCKSERLSSFTNGVILSTGFIEQGPSMTNQFPDTYWEDEDVVYGLGTDRDLDEYFNVKLNDPAGIVLYIQPNNQTINIPFFMASEEFYYQENQPYKASLPTLESYGDYSDKFAFFLKELGTADEVLDSNGQVKDDISSSMVTNAINNSRWNIAKLPDKITNVEIATVNQHTNVEYFVSNVATNEDGELVFPANDIVLPMEFNGAIVGPIAVAEGLDTNKVYKLKIVVGDNEGPDKDDYYVNSVVFLRARGITSGADLKIDITGPSSLVAPGTVTYTDTVSNIGPATADGVTVKHYLPEGVDFSSLVTDCSTGVVDPANWGTEGGTNYFVWTVGDRFASGSNAFLNVTYKLPTKGSYTNIASVVTSTGDYEESNNTDEIETVVGELPKLRVEAICTNKVYGSEISLSDLGFILSIDGTNETQIVSGIDVTFTNASGKVAYPTNALADVGTYGIYLSNIRDFDLSAFGDRIEYVGGTLEITRRPITITAKDNEKVYDGIPLTQSEFTVEGLPDGDEHKFTVVMTPGSTITDVGIEPNVIASVDGVEVEIKVEKEIDNYLVTVLPGQLEVTPAEVTLKANSDSFKYDGTEKSVTGYEPSVSGLAFNGVEALGKGTNAGEYDVTFSGVVIGTTKDTTGNYVVSGTTDGKLVITPAEVTLKANSDNFKYDGTEKSVTGYEPSVSGLAFNGVEALGKGTNAGEYDVTFS
ncbi:MAG: DUF11 domain-containing protein, partial [Kiritimatiellae bacterium]|nr:DUF11 domain-containing protein [Kiritimatiellia bacterium]